MKRTPLVGLVGIFVAALVSGCAPEGGLDGDDLIDPTEGVYGEENTAEAESALTRPEMVDIVMWYAYSQIGKSYQFGAAGPNAYDCSGLTKWVFAQAGLNLVHHAASQWNQGYHWNDMTDVWPADLLFFGDSGVISHVGIYVGNGQYIHAASVTKGVELQTLYPPPPGYKPYIGHARYF
jgi:cell wall-associated NlpC family hydrolase